jgi:hypothetical protein
MAFTHTYSSGWSNGNRSLTSTKTYSGTSELSIDEDIADSQTDFEIICAIDISAIQNIYIKSDQDVTLETNNGGTPDDTIDLKANVPYIFNAQLDAYFTNLLTTDVTAIYITNASGAAANLQIECLTDATP